jgi:ABC-2 type transport system ATP-binding protein
MSGEAKAADHSNGERPGATGCIIARDVVVKFGNVTALDHFSIDILKGTVGLLGPNGAGKSTFIKTVLGLVEPLGGQVTVAGLDARTSMAAIRDRIGYMPEHDCLIDTMTAIELVSYMGRLSGMSKCDAIPRSHEMLDFVGVGEERYRPIGTYSTGMKQRVKLAQAIVHDPDILFLDEPTNGMDPLGREEMLELVGRIAASDKTILVSSHILQDVEKVCRDVVVITGGRAVAQGNIDQLLAQGKGRKRLQVRGGAGPLKAFLERLGDANEVISVSEEFGQVTVVLVAPQGSRPIFEAAEREGVQVRSYTSDRMTLEDYFISAVKEAV